jgi:hypothetical protein
VPFYPSGQAALILYGGAYEPAGPSIANLDFRMNNGATNVLGDGTLLMTTIDLPAGRTISTLYWLSGTTALVNGATPHYWLALFDSSRNLLRQSPDNTAKAVGASTVISDTLSSPFTTTYGGQHYVGIMVASGAGTQPTYTGFASLTAPMGLNSVGGGKFNGTSNTGLTTTAPNPANLINQTNPVPWVGVS